MRPFILFPLVLLLAAPLCAAGSDDTTVVFNGVRLPLEVPDGDPGGIISRLLISGCDTIEDLDVSLEIDHGWVGDLVVVLESPSGTQATLVDRPGFDGSGYGCEFSGLSAILDDEASVPVEDQCADDNGGSIPSINGVFIPNEALQTFDGELGSGIWTLRVSDWAAEHTGKLLDWQLGLDCSSRDVDLLPQLYADRDQVMPGGKVIFTLKLTNNGSETASGIEAVFELPPGMECQWAEPGALADGQLVTQRYGTMVPGEFAAAQLGVIVTAGHWGWLKVIVRMRAEQTDSNPRDNEVSAGVYVGPGPDVSVVQDQPARIEDES